MNGWDFDVGKILARLVFDGNPSELQESIKKMLGNFGSQVVFLN